MIVYLIECKYKHIISKKEIPKLKNKFISVSDMQIL